MVDAGHQRVRGPNTAGAQVVEEGGAEQLVERLGVALQKGRPEDDCTYVTGSLV